MPQRPVPLPSSSTRRAATSSECSASSLCKLQCAVTTKACLESLWVLQTGTEMLQECICHMCTVGNVYHAPAVLRSADKWNVKHHFQAPLHSRIVWASISTGSSRRAMPRPEGSGSCVQEHCTGRHRTPAQAVRGAPHTRAQAVAQCALPHRHAHAGILQVLQLRAHGGLLTQKVTVK